MMMNDHIISLMH